MKNLKALSCTISPRTGGQSISKAASILFVIHVYLLQPRTTQSPSPSPSVLILHTAIKYWRWGWPGNEARSPQTFRFVAMATALISGCNRSGCFNSATVHHKCPLFLCISYIMLVYLLQCIAEHLQIERLPPSKKIFSSTRPFLTVAWLKGASTVNFNSCVAMPAFKTLLLKEGLASGWPS